MERKIYRCSKCRAVFEALSNCKCKECRILCCSQPLELLKGKTEEEGREKHVPVVENGNVTRVRIGSVPHPMEKEHFIEWIEIETGGIARRKFLRPGQEPEAEFCICGKSGKISARALCNVHGLWKA
jgi:superoxide reductase